MLQYQAEFVGNQTRLAQYRQSSHMEHSKNTRKDSPYLISVWMQARALMVRRWEILSGDKSAVVLNTGSVIVGLVSTVVLTRHH